MTARTFAALVAAGRIDDARALIERQKAQVKFAPDTIMRTASGGVLCTRRGTVVEQDTGGTWRLKVESK